MNRRGFLIGAAASIAAPTLIKVESLMRLPPRRILIPFDIETRGAITVRWPAYPPGEYTAVIIDSALDPVTRILRINFEEIEKRVLLIHKEKPL